MLFFPISRDEQLERKFHLVTPGHPTDRVSCQYDYKKNSKLRQKTRKKTILKLATIHLQNITYSDELAKFNAEMIDESEKPFEVPEFDIVVFNSKEATSKL